MTTGEKRSPRDATTLVGAVMVGTASTVQSMGWVADPNRFVTVSCAVPDAVATEAGYVGVPMMRATPPENCALSPAGRPVAVKDVGAPVTATGVLTGEPERTVKSLGAVTVGTSPT